MSNETTPDPATRLGSTTLAQVALVVKDIAEASRRWAEVLGVPIPAPIVTQPGNVVEQTFRGAPSSAQAKLAFFHLGQVQLELIEPIGEGPSTWHETLEKYGEGLHHIAFWVEGMPRSAAFLQSQDILMIQRGDMGEGQFAYFDAEERLGVTLELLERVRRDGRVPTEA
jgi:catechol 2,3-dioxygenase-like lactoylglutathione lyase family enzyme